MKVLEPFIDRRMVVLRQDDTIQTAARALCDNKVGCIVVADDQGRITGIVTDRDLTCYPLAYGIPASEPLERVMTTDTLYVTENVGLDRVIRIMVENGIRRVPVVKNVKNGQRCVGIVTLDDLIVSKAIDADSLARIIQGQVVGHELYNVRLKNEERASRRTQARCTQAMNRFFNLVARKAKLDRETAERVTMMLLRHLLRRIHSREAVKFTSQLPRIVQNDLLSVAAGPDRQVTARMIVDDVRVITGRSVEQSEWLVRAVWDALDDVLGHGEMEHLFAQLPQPIRRLLVGGLHMQMSRVQKQNQGRSPAASPHVQ